MPREEFRSQLESSKTIVGKLSREELLELLEFHPFFVCQLREQDINGAKARVLRRKADAAFKQYLAVTKRNSECKPKGAKQMAAYYASIRDGEAFYKKYQTLWDKADRLEFGHLRNKEAINAAE